MQQCMACTRVMLANCCAPPNSLYVILTLAGDAAGFASKYAQIAFQAANYFMQHFKNVSASGRDIVWPAQVLETYWCDYDPGIGYTNCCEDDAPSVSAMSAVLGALLALPDTLTTPAQRAEWAAYVANRLPLLPLSADGSIIAPARILSNGVHNNEGPELYPIHPHRVFTKGKAVASGLNISIALATYASSSFKDENSGWNYGLCVRSIP